MVEQESAAARNANKHFRKEAQARDGAELSPNFGDARDQAAAI